MLGSAQASELVFEFANPSFSGQGASAHWLTIENQEASRERSLQDEIEAALRQAEIDERSRPENRFVSNLQTRIYSQLAQQVVEELFFEEATEGFLDLEGSTLSYETVDGDIRLVVTSDTGTITEISIPMTGFGFAGADPILSDGTGQ